MTGDIAHTICASIWKSANATSIRSIRHQPSRTSVNNIFHLHSAPLPGWHFQPCRPSVFSTALLSLNNVSSRSFTYGGIFAVGKSPSTAEKAFPRRPRGIEKPCYPKPIGSRQNIALVASLTWKRSLHSNTQDGGHSNEDKGVAGKKKLAYDISQGRKKEELVDLSSHNSNILNRLPHMPHFHRPTKEELLAAATGFWSRLKVRFKWFSIRSVRPFNMDDMSAFFSWFLLGHVIWLLVGTTTFLSLAILAINTVFAQETLARWVGNYLTQSSGLKVVFESAIVPKWGDGVITFKNVFVSRRPGQGNANVSKGSTTSAAAKAAALAAASKSGEGVPNHSIVEEESEDTNYTQFDLTIDTVNVTLSFAKWFNGRGLLRDVSVQGIRGVVDRTSVHYSGEYVDPRTYKHHHNPGDFELDSFKMEDVLVTIHQPGGFRPFSMSIYSCDLPQLRKQWLFYDFLSANTISGSFDESLFTIHPRQTQIYSSSPYNFEAEPNGDPNPWKKHSRLRIDGLSIDHLNRGVEGPFSWIHEGNVDITADIMLPADDEESIAKVMSDFYDRMEATVTSNAHIENYDPAEDATINNTSVAPPKPDDTRFIIMDMRVNLNDVRAAVPLFTHDLSYVNNALIRPIVAYINSRKTSIPIRCRVVKRASEFDGSWTLFDSGLMDDLSAETYEAFARNVQDDQARMRRFRKVGFWSLQLFSQALFMGMAGNIM